MKKIIILPNNNICFYGKCIRYNNLNSELTVCDFLLMNDINIRHDCGKFGKCLSCLILVKSFKFLNNINYDEREIISSKEYNFNNYRLSCQIFDFENIIISLF